MVRMMGHNEKMATKIVEVSSYLPRGIVPPDPNKVGSGLTGLVVGVTDEYLRYLRLTVGIEDGVTCVCKIVEPCTLDEEAEGYYSMTDVMYELVFNVYISARDPTLIVPIIHWFIYYTDKEDGYEEMLMNSHGDNPNSYINRLHAGTGITIVDGDEETSLLTDICWNMDQLKTLDRPLTPTERKNRTTITTAVITMPKYDGDLKTLMLKKQEPPMEDRYMMCSEMMKLISRLHKCGVVHGDNHEKNILYAETIGPEGDRTIFRLHDFGRAQAFEKLSDYDLADEIGYDLVRLGAVCYSILIWRQTYTELAPKILRFNSWQVKSPFAKDMLYALKNALLQDNDVLKSGEYLETIRENFDKAWNAEADAVKAAKAAAAAPINSLMRVMKHGGGRQTRTRLSDYV
jgi:hypothetical protein